MRSAILDVGSNSAHLDVVDLVPNGPLRLITTIKEPTRLAESITTDGGLDARATRRLSRSVRGALKVAWAADATELVAFATSAVRDAANRVAVVEEVAARTGVRLGFLSGRDEARLTFLAARGWYGWSAGPLLLADIGGGSLEVATGTGAEPEAAVSMPLGAGRLTRDLLPGDPPSRRELMRLRRHIMDGLETGLGESPLGDWLAELQADGREPQVVATSRTFTQLAKLTGDTRHGQPVLRRQSLERVVGRLAKRTAAQRARLKGVSASRSRQILAGALVAESLMDMLELRRFDICPWALREGVALRLLARITTARPVDGDIDHLVQPLPGQPRLHMVSGA